MKKNFWKKLLILLISFNLMFSGPVMALTSPTPPPAPSSPSEPSDPPSTPTPPPAPSDPPSTPTPPPVPGTETSPSPSATVTETNEATNTGTGANSVNESTINNEDNLNVTNENDGQVTNEVLGTVNTGGNTSSYNTGGGSITTGDAVQSLTVITNLNQNSTLAYPNEYVENYANNNLTGSGSLNASVLNNKLNTNIYNANSGNLSNKIMLNSISGQNTSSYNTGSGNVNTGSANADLTLLSALNTNVTGTGGIKTFNIYDTHQGDLVFDMADFKDGAQFQSGNPEGSYESSSKNVADNAVTGADSQNSSSVGNETNKNVGNTNQAKLTNDIEINALSGGNSSSKNSQEGDVQTGDANAVASLVNFLNTNLVVDEWMIAVVNIFGELIGDIVLPKDDGGEDNNSNSSTVAAGNSLTGADSSNNSEVNNTNNASFENYNDAEVLNNIETAAVTGANSASYNTGPGEVSDGDATVSTQVVNVANTNATSEGETFWLVLVNKMGEWVGNIIGSEGEVIAGNLVVDGPIPEFSEGNMENLEQAANVATGASSDNDSSVNNETNTTVTNTNSGVIENNISINAVSGDNTGSYNTLGGDVEAGDATVGLSLVNFINTNLVGKKLIVMVIDVVGKWIGDVIPPDQEKQANNGNVGALNNPSLPEGMVEVGNNEFESGSSSSSSYQEESFSSTYLEQPNNIPLYWSTNNLANSGNFSSGPTAEMNLLRTNSVYRRGLFFSPVFAKETDILSGSTNNVQVTEDWLYFLVPSFFGVVASKSKKLRVLLASLF